jgi:hypothetical protein
VWPLCGQKGLHATKCILTLSLKDDNKVAVHQCFISNLFKSRPMIWPFFRTFEPLLVIFKNGRSCGLVFGCWHAGITKQRLAFGRVTSQLQLVLYRSRLVAYSTRNHDSTGHRSENGPQARRGQDKQETQAACTDLQQREQAHRTSLKMRTQSRRMRCAIASSRQSIRDKAIEVVASPICRSYPPYLTLQTYKNSTSANSMSTTMAIPRTRC